MKPAFVSLALPLLFLVQPNQKQQRSIVISGRVTDSTTLAAVQAANVRVIEAGASVGTDTSGR